MVKRFVAVVKSALTNKITKITKITTKITNKISAWFNNTTESDIKDLAEMMEKMILRVAKVKEMLDIQDELIGNIMLGQHAFHNNTETMKKATRQHC